MGRRKKDKKKQKKKRRPVRTEWVGGLVELPTPVDEEDGEFLPFIAIWLERPRDVIIGTEVVAPEDAERAFAESFVSARADARREPARVRVARQDLADRIRLLLPRGAQLVVAPTPEIDAAFADLLRNVSGMAPLGEENLGLMERLFGVARALHASAPWKRAVDDCLVNVDIPDLGVRGACVTIRGMHGEPPAIALYDSPEVLDAFTFASLTPPDERIALGGEAMLLSFQPEKDVPSVIVREAKKNGWKTAAKDAFPFLMGISPDGRMSSVAPEGVVTMTAVASALTALVRDNPDALGARGEKAVRMFPAVGLPTVQLSVSFLDDEDIVNDDFFDEDLHDDEAFFNDFPQQAPLPKTRKVGRNEPCPCGSGKKYKKCCLGKSATSSARAPAHDFEMSFFDKLMAHGMQRLAPKTFTKAFEALSLAGEQFALPYIAYVLEDDGKTLAEHYRDDVAVDARTRAYIDAQSQAWVSVWEVIDLEPNESLTLRDLLSGEERLVMERSATKFVRKRSALLGRVVEFEGTCVLSGVHMRSLPPNVAEEVVARARRRLRRKRDVPVDRLNNEKFAAFLLRAWDDATLDLDERDAVPPQVVNTEGHALTMVEDHFSYETRAHDWLLERLERIELSVLERETATQAQVTFHMEGNPKIASWDNTIIGRARIADGRLVLETNSKERADRLRASVLEVVGDIVAERTRSFSDPMSEPNLQAMMTRTPAPEEPPPPEVVALIAETKRQHYDSWADTPLPALGGDTPRQHVRTADGRRAVEVLLKDFEFHEQRDPSTAYDVQRIRDALGLS